MRSEDVPDELLDTAVTEYWNADRKKEHGMRAALAAVAPVIQAEALERAADLAANYPVKTHGSLAVSVMDASVQICDEIAAAIRAMKEPDHG